MELSETEWLCVDVAGYKIINVCQPPTSRFTPTAIPTFPHPSLYAGVFNCQHVNWGYKKSSPDGESLDSWAASNNLGLLYNLKETASFSRRWNVGTNPDLAFASFGQDSRLPDRRVLGKFPRSQHRPSLIRPPKLKVPAHSDPVWSVGTFANPISSAFAFSQMHLLTDCHIRTHQTLIGHTRIFARAYFLQPNNLSHGRTMYHAGTRSSRPSIAPSPELQWWLTLIQPLRPYSFGSDRRSRSVGTKLLIPLTSRTLAARCEEPSTNSLAGLDASFASAPHL